MVCTIHNPESTFHLSKWFHYTLTLCCTLIPPPVLQWPLPVPGVAVGHPVLHAAETSLLVAHVHHTGTAQATTKRSAHGLLVHDDGCMRHRHTGVIAVVLGLLPPDKNHLLNDFIYYLAIAGVKDICFLSFFFNK